MNRDRLQYLLDRYFDQALSASEKQELERVLLDSADAREAFWELSQWNGAIRQWAEEECGRREVVEALPAAPQSPKLRVLPSPKRASAVVTSRSKPGRHASGTSGWWWPLAAAAAVAIGLFAWMQWNPGSRVQSGKSGVIARLSHASSAVWADQDSSHNAGEALRGGTLKLKSGAAQIDFSQGARVVLEGPAEFELLSANSGSLHHGKLIATVPKSAHGFTVWTPNFSIVDHGTQFGCTVPLTAAPEVHVFQGAVALRTDAKNTKELRKNQAVRLAGSQLQEIPTNLNTFLTEEKLARLEKWRQASRAFSQHPGMLVHFDFEKDSGDGTGRMLINRAPNALPETNGTIEGCEWSAGRWPGKSALKFSGSNDCVRLSVPGEYPAMTFVAFLRADRTPNRENSLIRAKPLEQLGEAHWYITGEGALGWSARIAPRGRANQWLHILSTPVFGGEALGSWHMAATVFDGTKVTHYLDGKEVGSGSARLPVQVRLGPLEVGNGAPVFGPRAPGEMVSNFVGSIDELAVLSVPLTGEEIQRLYKQGRPSVD